ncbi:MAG: Rne/Rng family ribonuclease [PVC group bacterium]|nr:Rne/Rng family ribonuclease [PVC group bacterium]
MMNREILISIDEQEKRVAVLEHGRLEEFFIERSSHRHIAGNVYKGRVAQVVKGMEAAFVDIGLGKNGFLYIQEFLPATLKDDDYSLEPAESLKETKGSKQSQKGQKKEHVTIENLLRKGQEVLVQVVKEPFGTKGCRLSSQISLPGRFLVLMPYSKNIGISKKITNDKERLRLRNLLKEIGLSKDMGCIIRTQAMGLGKREFVRELKYLMRLWQNIKVKASRKNAPSLIHEEYDLVLRTARDFFSEDMEKVVIDKKDDYKRVLNFIKVLAPQLRRRLNLHKEKMDLFDKYDVDKQSEEIFAREVPLKKGGYIVIEPTEALTSIDVNSGSFVYSDRLEETAYLTNMEAAKEIARQLRLRDLAGIIVIDFIDMGKSSHQKKVLHVLEKEMEKDKARFTIYPFSALGVVQIARQRIRRKLESIFFQSCPECKGRGRIKSSESIAIKALREIRKYLVAHKKRYLEVNVHPKVAMRLLNEDRGAITSLEKRMWVKIAVLTDEHLGIEEVRFL